MKPAQQVLAEVRFNFAAPFIIGVLFLLALTPPVEAIVGDAPVANQRIARHVVMVVGSDRTFCTALVWLTQTG
jgi:hypothetical protein